MVSWVDVFVDDGKWLIKINNGGLRVGFYNGMGYFFFLFVYRFCRGVVVVDGLFCVCFDVV